MLLCDTDRQKIGEQVSQITVPSCSGHMIPCLSVVIEYLEKACSFVSIQLSSILHVEKPPEAHPVTSKLRRDRPGW